MEEYTNVRESIIDFLKTACMQDYDAVYYYIGQYDFNQDDPISREVVADLILKKATKDKKNPYFSHVTVDLTGVLYDNAEEVPLSLGPRISYRQQAEKSAKANGMTYIPDSPKFVNLVCAAASELTKEDLAEMERSIKRSQTFTGQFTENLKRELSNPVENIGVGSMILYSIVIIYIILDLLT